MSQALRIQALARAAACLPFARLPGRRFSAGTSQASLLAWVIPVLRAGEAAVARNLDQHSLRLLMSTSTAPTPRLPRARLCFDPIRQTFHSWDWFRAIGYF
jgi:hypothetical protein